MSSIHSKNTTIDKKVASLLANAKIEFDRYPKVSGNPDFTIKDKKVAIFCDGDFWHGYDYKERKENLGNFWKTKIETNMRRDRKNNLMLKKLGWKVIRIWEHEINNYPEKCVNKILTALENDIYG